VVTAVRPARRWPDGAWLVGLAQNRLGEAGKSGRVQAGLAGRSVMVAGCEDDDLCFGDDVDEAVLVVNPP